jgi:hypothetical protein
MTEQIERRHIKLGLEVPLPWLLSCIGAFICALVYAGWNARELKFKLETGIEKVEQLIHSQNEIKKDLLQLNIDSKMHRAEIELLKNNIERIERRK